MSEGTQSLRGTGIAAVGRSTADPGGTWTPTHRKTAVTGTSRLPTLPPVNTAEPPKLLRLAPTPNADSAPRRNADQGLRFSRAIMARQPTLSPRSGVRAVGVGPHVERSTQASPRDPGPARRRPLDRATLRGQHRDRSDGPWHPTHRPNWIGFPPRGYRAGAPCLGGVGPCVAPAAERHGAMAGTSASVAQWTVTAMVGAGQPAGRGHPAALPCGGLGRGSRAGSPSCRKDLVHGRRTTSAPK